MQSSPGTFTPSSQPAWYKAYFIAVVERDRNKALLEIDRARRAIEQRFLELRQLPASSPREYQDLVHALTYLGILLSHIGRETGRVLWD